MWKRYPVEVPDSFTACGFYCAQCGKVYELKSKDTPIGKSILDGAYYSALEKSTSNTNPNLFVLHYHNNLAEDLTLIPKHFFTPDILVKRKTLSSNARRAGYVGSVIMYEDILAQGKIAVIAAHTELSRDVTIFADELFATHSANYNVEANICSVCTCKFPTF